MRAAHRHAVPPTSGVSLPRLYCDRHRRIFKRRVTPFSLSRSKAAQARFTAYPASARVDTTIDYDALGNGASPPITSTCVTAISMRQYHLQFISCLIRQRIQKAATARRALILSFSHYAENFPCRPRHIFDAIKISRTPLISCRLPFAADINYIAEIPPRRPALMIFSAR